MSGLKIFFGAYKYLTNCVKESLKSLDYDQLKNIFKLLINARKKNKSIITDGQGRSLQSMMLTEDCLEHNGFPIIFPAANANVRPWRNKDIFFFNSGSGSGSPLKHAQSAKEDGLHVVGMTQNKKILEEFPDSVLILNPSQKKNSIYAPLGTEFEFCSALIGACIGSSVNDTVGEANRKFQMHTQTLLELFDNSIGHFEENLDSLLQFLGVIEPYIEPENVNNVYFQGVGRDEIVNHVAGIRYGHLHKVKEGKVLKDLRVITMGHWDLRKDGDLAIVTSGSGATSQTLNYCLQAFISGMKIYGFTSFEDSDLGKFSRRVDGCLVIPGRRDRFSMYNVTLKHRRNFLPEFELNTYLTLDSLLSQLAVNHDITEADMKAIHRLKALE
jgi:D-arabinose 5-phosphate isomerase GutQ